MTMRKMLVAATLSTAAFGAAAAGGDRNAAEDRPLDQLIPVCAACHGERGDEALQPDYPLLAGQYATYLEQALRQYRDGERQNPVMQGQAAELTNGEIRALARYFAGQDSPLYTPAAPATD